MVLNDKKLEIILELIMKAINTKLKEFKTLVYLEEDHDTSRFKTNTDTKFPYVEYEQEGLTTSAYVLYRGFINAYDSDFRYKLTVTINCPVGEDPTIIYMVSNSQIDYMGLVVSEELYPKYENLMKFIEHVEITLDTIGEVEMGKEESTFLPPEDWEADK